MEHQHSSFLRGTLVALSFFSFFAQKKSFAAGRTPALEEANSDAPALSNPQVIYKVYVAPARAKPIQVAGFGDKGGIQEVNIDADKLSDILMNQLAATGRFKMMNLEHDFPKYPGLLVIEPDLDYILLNAIDAGAKVGTSKGLASKFFGVSASAGASFKANEIGMDFKIRNCGERSSDTVDLSSCMIQSSIHISSKSWTTGVNFDLSADEIAEISAQFQKNTSVQKAFVELFQEGAKKLLSLNVFSEGWNARVLSVNQAQTLVTLNIGMFDGIRPKNEFEIMRNPSEEELCSIQNKFQTTQTDKSQESHWIAEDTAMAQCASVPLARIKVISAGMTASTAIVTTFLDQDLQPVNGNREEKIKIGNVVRLIPAVEEKNTSKRSRPFSLLRHSHPER